MNRTLFAVLAAAGLSVVACQKSGTDAQQEANRAQAEANKDIADQNAKSQTQITNAQVEADKKIATVQKDFVTTRENYRHDVTENLASFDKKLADLDAKAKKATGNTKAKLDSMLPSLHAQRNSFAQDIAVIPTVTADAWDATKVRLDKEWNDLDHAIGKAD